MVNFTENNSYEYSDFNRVETSILDYKNQLKDSNISDITIETPKINWIEDDLPILEDFKRIENNFTLTDFSGNYVKRNFLEKMPFSYIDANRWEQQSQLLITRVENIRKDWIICGKIKCGGNRI